MIVDVLLILTVTGILLLAVGGLRLWWAHWSYLLDRLREGGELGECRCWTCRSGLADGEHDDDLMDVVDAVFEDGARPVNEPRSSWDRLDGRNRGAWLDAVSRASNTQNARWITGRQQESAGRSLADEAADFLAAEAAREARRREAARETTGEIRRGEPGE